ncbi:MAG: hypothetical protein IJZ04_04160 [Clostridia bacterium]|nr:hypothetical protein [Clostridia bacterium]
MDQHYQKTFRICATCQYWGGTRRFSNSFNNVVVVSSPMLDGPCYNPNSGYRHLRANGSCPKYTLWSAIR